MEEQRFFRDALEDFTYEAACGGAIRHLTDLGYTVRQIADRLDFPIPYERVRRAVWERLVDTEVILLEEPGSRRRRKGAVYVREYDRYGRASFRQVAAEDAKAGEDGWPGDAKGGRERSAPENGSEGGAGDGGVDRGERPAGDGAAGWRERCVCPEIGPSAKELALALHKGIRVNGRESSYVSCDFGLTALRAKEEYGRMLEILEDRQREYLTGLLWAEKRVYHRLDSRMTEILLRLYGAGCWSGTCYFLKTRETVSF